jgi:hypothetical protein
MRDYLIYCTYCDEYSALGHYLPKEGRFEGEYSLLYNQHTHDNELLCRFLLAHLGHHVKSIPNKTDEYSQIIRESNRFMEAEIDQFVYENQQRQLFAEQERRMDRGLGQLQLNVLNKMLQEEAKMIAKIPTETSAESQFLLGKEEGIKRAVALITELMEKANMLYK